MDFRLQNSYPPHPLVHTTQNLCQLTWNDATLNFHLDFVFNQSIQYNTFFLFAFASFFLHSTEKVQVYKLLHMYFLWSQLCPNWNVQFYFEKDCLDFFVFGMTFLVLLESLL